MQLPILAYHSVLRNSCSHLPSGWSAPDTISYSSFCAQLDAFRAERRRSFPANRLNDPNAWSLSEKAILFTFDDGHDSDLLAAEALEERGFTAIFFIPWTNVGRFRFLGRGDIKRLCRNGFVIGSHGLTHSRFTDLSPGLLRTELVESKARFEDLVGQSVNDLALPFGRYNRRVIESVRDAGYTAIMTSNVGLASLGSGNRVFPRVPVKPSMRNSLVYDIIAGSFLAKLNCRFQGSIVRRAKAVFG